MTTPTMPPIRRTDRPASLKSHEGWASVLTKTAGQHAQDGALQAAIRTHKAVTDAWDGLEALRQTRNPKDTAAEHLTKVDRAVKQLAETVNRKTDALLDTLEARRSHLKREIHDRLGIRQSDEVAEFRQMLRALQPQKRGDVIRRAIDHGDSVAMSALMLTQSPTLLGMEPAHLEQYRTRAVRAHAADLLALGEALDAAQSLALDALTDTVGLSAQAGGDTKTREEYQRQTEAAEQAALKLATALS